MATGPGAHSPEIRQAGFWPWTGDCCPLSQARGRQLCPCQPRSPTRGRWIPSTVPKAVRGCPGHPLSEVHFSQALSQCAATHPTWLRLSVHQRGRGRGRPGRSATRPSVHGCLRHWVSLAASTDLQGEARQFQDFPRRKKQNRKSKVRAAAETPVPRPTQGSALTLRTLGGCVGEHRVLARFWET